MNLTECNCFPGNFAPDCPGANEELQVQGSLEEEHRLNTQFTLCLHNDEYGLFGPVSVCLVLLYHFLWSC